MFKFQCKFNYKNYIAFQRYAFRLQIPTLLIFIGIAFFICCFFNLTPLDFIIAGLVFFVVFPLFVFLNTLMTAKNTSKTSRIISDDTIDTFVFTEDVVYLKEVNGAYRITMAFPYDYFYRVCETKKHYFLFISQGQALIVEKYGIQEGNLDSLSNFLRLKLSNKKFKSYR